MPFVVVVSGLPAAGKSTLAERLGRDLRIPVVCRDALRPGPFGDDTTRATTRLVLDALAAALDTSRGAVLDGNFNRPGHSDGLRELLESRRARVFEVCLWADADVLTTRFAERAEPPLTKELEPYFHKVLHRARTPVLPAADCIVEFDTTEFGALDEGYAGLLEAIRGF